MPNGLDSASRLNAIAAKNAGYSAWGRYLAGNYKMNATEVASATAEGIGLWSIYETGADNALGGASEAAIDAQGAVIAAIALKQPKGSAIYCTVDFDPTQEQLTDVIEYVRAFTIAVRSDGYKGGCYGGAIVMEAVANMVDYRWQAGGWSNGITVPGCALHQKVTTVSVGGVVCDLNVIQAADYGAWNLHGLFPAPAPKPPAPKPQPVPTEDPVTLHTVSMTIGANGQGEVTTAVSYANAFGPTILAGEGPVIIDEVSIANANGNAVIVLKGGPAGSVVSVRFAEAA